MEGAAFFELSLGISLDEALDDSFIDAAATARAYCHRKWQRTKSGRRTGVAPLGRRRRARAGARTARPDGEGWRRFDRSSNRAGCARRIEQNGP
jgi:hypothetical protein